MKKYKFSCFNTKTQKGVNGSPKYFTDKNVAEEVLDMNVRQFGGIKKESHDIFSKTIDTKLGLTCKLEKIEEE